MGALPAAQWHDQPSLLNEAYSVLAQLLELKEDWDYEGAPSISSTAVERAQALLQAIKFAVGQATGDIRPYDIAPLANGGVQIERFASVMSVALPETLLYRFVASPVAHR